MKIEINARRAGSGVFIVAWLCMLLLAATSFATAFLRLGFFAPLIEFAIAAIMASMLFLLFMRLKGPPSLNWVFAAAGFVWLLFLFGLSMTDYADRRGWPNLYVPTTPDRAIHIAQ